MGTALSAVVHSAKKKLQDSATTVGDNALVKFAAQVLLMPLTASRVDDDLARACCSREDRAVVKFARDFLLGDAASGRRRGQDAGDRRPPQGSGV